MSLAFVVLALVVAATIVCGVSIWIGMQFQRDLDRKIAAMTPMPTRPAPARALTQWQCTKQERIDYIGTCAHRIWAEKIKETKK
jgi:hypothetical protein